MKKLGGAITLAGFAGAPPSDAEPFLASVRDAIIEYIREQRLERPVLVGHSLGAFLAFWIAATEPELVGPVVGVDGVPFLTALAHSTRHATNSVEDGRGEREGHGPEPPGWDVRASCEPRMGTVDLQHLPTETSSNR